MGILLLKIEKKLPGQKIYPSRTLIYWFVPEVLCECCIVGKGLLIYPLATVFLKN